MIEKDIREILLRIEDKVQAPDSRRQQIADVLEGKRVDRLPLTIRRTRTANAPGASYDLKEQFYDPEKMLYAHLVEIERIAGVCNGLPLTLRPNFGTIVVPAAFGLGYSVFETTLPWLTEHAPIEDIARLEDMQPANSPIIEKAVSYIAYFRERLPDWIHVYQPDTQGIFDIAHLLIGNDLFYLLYDDPELVHRLMRLSLRAFIEITDRLKAALDEPTDQCFHGHALASGLYMRNGGVRVSEDTVTLLCGKHIDEFAVPYIEQALARYGGGFVHFCGRSPHLLHRLASLKGVRAINLGNPEMYDFNEVMRLCLDNDRVYFGNWHRRDGETAEAYIGRMKAASEGGTRGLLLHINEDLFGDVPLKKIQALWDD